MLKYSSGECAVSRSETGIDGAGVMGAEYASIFNADPIWLILAWGTGFCHRERNWSHHEKPSDCNNELEGCGLECRRRHHEQKSAKEAHANLPSIQVAMKRRASAFWFDTHQYEGRLTSYS